MARLFVKLHGQEVANIKLEAGQEYIAGRAPDAAIRLHDERGISRHHLKFYERDGVWICESLSKFVLIQQGKEQSEVIEMTAKSTFSVPPYEFHYDPEAPEAQESGDVETPAENAEPSRNLPTFYQPRLNAKPNSGPSPDDTKTGEPSRKGNNEATIAGKKPLTPYLRISYPNTADDEVLKLEGHHWTAGRGSDCEINIDSPHVSRRHFEFSRTKEGFFLTDLGSSNGTKVNGTKVPPHEPAKVESGDEIQIMTIRMIFEIRDTQFSNRLENLPVPAFDPMLAAPMWSPPHDMTMQIPAMLPPPEANRLPALREWKQFRPHHLKQVPWKKHKLRVILALALPVLLIGLLRDPKPKKPDEPNDGTKSVSFENLKPEQKSVVKDSFHLARNLYVQGKYALCLTELAKVHEVIPQFENSKELQSFCEQGLELVRRQEDLDRKERERALIEQQITGFVEGCKQKLSANATVEETRQCLAEAIVLAPEHTLVIEMLHTAQMHEEEARFMSEQKKAEQNRMQKGFSHYQKASEMYKSGRLSASISEFERYLAGNYPRNLDKKQDARRQVASIKAELKTKVGALLAECKALGAKNKFKEAYKACDRATDEDPRNAAAKAEKEKLLKEVRREMKVIYEDSVLEESLGNVDSAKEKWKKIMAEDLEFDDYYIKAKSKLQKYGGNL
jgi:pSer/pThr/pTyr-binding forkhead associated (FHA) protein/tetratricopeptide (TPR) repeat protein